MPVGFVGIDSTSNAISFNYGDLDVDPEQLSTVDILFTVTVADEDFADELQLTNQVTVFEGNTFLESTSSDGIIQFTYEQAELEITKGVIATDNTNGVITPGSPDMVPTLQVDKTVSSASGNPGDVLDFTIVVDASGGTAFDVMITDLIADPDLDLVPGSVTVSSIEGSTSIVPQAPDGFVVNADYIGINETLTITYQATVLNAGTFGTTGADAASSAHTAFQFDPTGSAGFRGSHDIGSEALAGIPIDANLTGIDAGDTVSFVITVENTGTLDRGAFDIAIRDTLPAGFAIPTTPSGLNLSITDGNGTALAFTGGLFAPGGIQLTDPSGTQGALASSEEGATGTNVAFITYDLIALQTVEPNQALTNVATITNYASREGGTDHVPGDDLSDTATVTTTSPSIVKTLVSTDHAGTTGSSVTIGESVTYHITVTLPEGTTEDVVISDIIPGSNAGTLQILSATVSSIDAAITSPLISAGATNATGVFNFGDLVNTDTDNAVAEQIVIEVVVQVGDDAGNTQDGVTDDGDTLVNQGRLNYTDANDVAQQIQNSASVVVVEPDLNITKVASAPSIDGSDDLTYTITVQHDAASSAIAYDLVIADLLADVDLFLDDQTVVVTHSALGNITATPGVVTSGNGIGDTTVGVAVADLDLGETLTITFGATIDTDVVPGQVLPNTATLNYDSLPPSVGSEGVDREYNESANEQVSVPDPVLLKDVISTSHAGTGTGQHTGVEDLTIGEVVVYELEIELPEGHSTITLTDNLPAGLQYVSSVISHIGGDLTSGAGFMQGDTVPTSFTASSVVYNFGTVVNSPDGDTDDDDRIRVQVTAVVLDDAANQDGNLKRNNASLVHDNGTVTAFANVDIVEPDLNIAKSVTPGTVDGDDFVTYTVVIDHDALQSHAHAYDVAISDLLADPDLFLDDQTVVVMHSALGNITASPGVVTSGNGVGDTTVGLYLSELLMGDSVTVTFQAQIDSDVTPNQIISNTADVDYDTLPGADPNERDYNEDDSAQVQVIAPTLTKTVFSTTLTETGAGEHTAGVQDLVVGELVTYDLVIQVPEGESNLVLTDNLPSTNGVLSYVSHQILPYGSNVSSTQQLVTVSDAALGDGHDDRIVFDFGTVTNTPDNVSDADDLITVRVTALVENEPANADGDLLTNNARLDYDGGGFVTDTATVEIVEPVLQIDKGVSSATADAGDVLTYTLTVDHTGASTATAFDAVVADLLADPHLELVGGSVVVLVDGVAPTVNFTVTPQAPDGFIVNIDKIDQGEVLTVQYQARVLDSAVFGTDSDNTATLDWDSNPSDIPADPSRGPVTLPEDTETVSYPDPTFAKTIVAGSTTVAETGSGENDAGLIDLVIGEQVTFALTITVPEGTSDITLTDNLPPGLTYISSFIETMSTQVTSTNGFVDGSNMPTSSSASQVVYDFGTVVNTGTPNDGTQQIIVHVTAVANAIPGNVNDADLLNGAQMTYTTEDAGWQPDHDNTDGRCHSRDRRTCAADR